MVEMPARNDVKGVVMLACFLVTRDPRYAVYYLDDEDESDVQDVAKWTHGAAAQKVALDHPATIFHAEVHAAADALHAGAQPARAAGPAGRRDNVRGRQQRGAPPDPGA